MSLSELATIHRLAGTNSVIKKLKENKVEKLFLAKDAEKSLIESILVEAKTLETPVEFAENMLQLGRACAVPRKTAVAAILKKEETIDK